MTNEHVMQTLMNVTFMDYQKPELIDNFKQILERLKAPHYNVEEKEAFLVLTIVSGLHTLVISYSMEDYCWTVIHQTKPTPETWGTGLVERSGACQIAAGEDDGPLRQRGLDHDIWFNDIYRADDVQVSIYPIVAGFLKAAAILEYVEE